MVEDLKELVDYVGEKKIDILGHSMGGKTAIGFTAKFPELVDKLIVADITHKKYPMHHELIIDGMESLDLDKIKSRGEADQVLAQKIQDWGVRQFLLKNLYWKEKGKLAWRINLPVLKEQMANILAEIPFKTIENKTLFIRGGKSNYILESDYKEIAEKFPNAEIYTLEDSGHWVHAEAPDEFFNQVMQFLLYA